MTQDKIGRLMILGGILIITACGSPSTTDNTNTSDPNSTQGLTGIDYAAATKSMAYRISRAYDEIDPTIATFLVDDARIEMFKQQAQSQDLQTQIVARSHYAYELLNAGKNERAITALEELLKEYEKYNVEAGTSLRFHRMLAIAYLRLGEQENCINSRNPESCILPISEEGRYRMTSGSEAAMRKCIEVLKEYPNDAETMYILNLAAMTIGKYPSGVPAKWLMPEASITSGAKFARFHDVSHDKGIRGTGLSGGACIDDFDGDGWLDIIRSSWGKDDPLIFWKNDGTGKFVDKSVEMGLSGINGGLNMLHADINNDGLVDVLVLRGAWMRDQGKIPNSMLLNLGDGKFGDVTLEAGLLTYAPTQSAVFADFNLDGWIDLFIGNESSGSASYPSEFYLNNGDGTFTNVINEIGVSLSGMIKGSSSGDINNDGWPDLFVSVLQGPNKLLIHQGLNAAGVPQFKDMANEAGVTLPILSFPTWMWDYDQDGWDDIFVSCFGEGELLAARDFMLNAKGQELGGHPLVYHNNGDNTFTDVSEQLGLKDNIYAMGCNYGDLDGDGYQDFYLGTGTPEFSSVVPNKMYRNNGGKSFDDVTAAGGFGHIQKGHGIAFGDLDRDGDEDIFECLGGAFDGDVYEDILFENPIGQNNNWVVLQLRGVKSNKMAIGAKVKLIIETPGGERTLYRTVSTGGSFGASSLQLEVGLGDATKIREISITWPNQDQTVQVLRDVQMKKYVRITEGNNTPEYADAAAVQM